MRLQLSILDVLPGFTAGAPSLQRSSGVSMDPANSSRILHVELLEVNIHNEKDYFVPFNYPGKRPQTMQGSKKDIKLLMMMMVVMMLMLMMMLMMMVM